MARISLVAERACQHGLERELAAIPSTLAKLARVSLCRDSETGYYRHQQLSAAHGDTVAANILRRFHEEIFGDWLALPLGRQKQDVEAFLNSPLKPPWGILLNAPVEQYAWLIPDSALEVERDLFLSDLRIVLSISAQAGVTGLVVNGKRSWEWACSPYGKAETATGPAVMPLPCSARGSGIMRILIADGDEIVRQGVRKIVEVVPDFKVVGEAGNGREAIQMAAESAADLVIMEAAMPEVNGVETTRTIVQYLPHCEVLIFTADYSEEWVRGVLQAGARGYLLKSDPPQELIRAIRAIQNGQIYFSSHVPELLLSSYLESKSKASHLISERPLTARERDIVQLLVDGKSDKQAAAVLGISPKTVQTHRLRMMGKLNLRTFGQLVQYAVRNSIASA